jgi:inorganic pyrophosphatase
VRVFIENPAGSLVKHIYDEKTLELKGRKDVSRAYPLPYGFVLNTTAEDGDNVDCFVVTNTVLSSGQILECEAVGLMEQIEDGEIDHKILAVIPGEQASVDDAIQRQLADFARHVFDHVPGKTMQIGAFRDANAALAHLRQHQDPDPRS